MSLILFNNDKEILRISSGGFAGLYQNIQDLIEQKNIQLSEALQNLIDELYSATYGMGLDISEYLKTKQDYLSFTELLKEALENFIKKTLTLTEESKKRLWNFYSELYNYAQSLK